VLIFIEALRILTHGLRLVTNFLSNTVLWIDWFRSLSLFFSFIVIAWCEPCFYFRVCNAKDSIWLVRFGLSVGLHPARFGARLESPDSSEHPHALRFC